AGAGRAWHGRPRRPGDGGGGGAAGQPVAEGDAGGGPPSAAAAGLSGQRRTPAMRSTMYLAVAALALAAGPARAADLAGGPWTVEGYGKTEFDAEQDALQKAAELLDTYLTQNAPEVEWRPDAAW